MASMNEHSHPYIFSSSRTVAHFAVDVVFLFIASASVAIRGYCRFLKKVPFGLDDACVILALLFLIGFFCSDCYEIFGGYGGHHIEDLQPDQMVKFAKGLFIGEMMYPFSVTFARLSINMLFLRVFDVRSYRRAAYANILLNVGWGLYAWIAPLTRCIPVAKNWNPEIATGHCKSLTSIELVIPIWGIVCDLTTWTLPLPLVWKLQMSLAHRIGLTCIFAIGLVVVAIGGVRIATVFQQNTEDITYGTSTAAIIAYVEPALAIFCACGPVFRPFVDKVLNAFPLHDFFSGISLKSKSKAYDPLIAGSAELHHGKFSGGSGISRTSPGHSTAGSSANVSGKNLHGPTKTDQIAVRSDITVTRD